jgi:hypothetical protein
MAFPAQAKTSDNDEMLIGGVQLIGQKTRYCQFQTIDRQRPTPHPTRLRRATFSSFVEKDSRSTPHDAGPRESSAGVTSGGWFPGSSA